MTVILLVILGMTCVMAQNEIYEGDTTILKVEPIPGDSYTWEIYRDSTVNFAITPGDATSEMIEFPNGNTGDSVQVKWLDYGVFFYKVTATDPSGCPNNIKVGRIEILEGLPTATLSADSICVGDVAVMQVKFTGRAPWDFTYTNGTDSWTITGIETENYELVIDPGPKSTSEYWVTEVTDKRKTNTEDSEHVILEVHPKPNSSRIYQYDNE